MSETYQSKYQQIFYEGSRCVVLNEAQFQGQVTIIAGQNNPLPPTGEKVKEALETLSSEGLISADAQWWAVYRVLSMPSNGYPVDKRAFQNTIDNLQPQMTHPCKYDNWRKYQTMRLTSSPEHWADLTNLGAADEGQRRVALRLMELLQQ